jgi:type IV pilus assembly protein PilB
MESQQGQAAKRIGELLMELGLATPRQLEQALERQRSTGQFLGVILLEMGAITEQGLLEAISRQFGIPHEPLVCAGVDWAVAKQFPPSVLSNGNGFPIRADAQSVTVAITNPLDVWTLSELEHLAGRRTVRPVLVLERELRAVVQEHQRQTLRALEARLERNADER